MLRIAFLALQSVVLGLITYNLITALWGWPNPALPPRGSRARRFTVVVPAHDEEEVIAAVVGDLKAADYPAALMTVWVIADRCSDGTASAARAAGAQVAERSDGVAGKGAALEWFLENHPLGEGGALLVFDADNRVPPSLIGRLADEFDRGAAVVQGYVDTTEPDESWVSLASALSYWAGNRMVQLSRHNLGWPVDLAGTGMGLTSTALATAGGFGDALVEDRDLSVRLALADIPVAWVHDVRVRDEKPAAAKVVIRQRARWAAGKREVARRHFGGLLAAGWRRRRWGLFDEAIRLVQPSRTFIALLSVILAITAGLTASEWLMPWQVWGLAAGVQFLLPLPFLIRDRVGWRRVLQYPLLAGLAILWIPVQVASRRVTGWVRTPHRG